MYQSNSRLQTDSVLTKELILDPSEQDSSKRITPMRVTPDVTLQVAAKQESRTELVSEGNAQFTLLWPNLRKEGDFTEQVLVRRESLGEPSHKGRNALSNKSQEELKKQNEAKVEFLHHIPCF